MTGTGTFFIIIIIVPLEKRDERWTFDIVVMSVANMHISWNIVHIGKPAHQTVMQTNKCWHKTCGWRFEWTSIIGDFQCWQVFLFYSSSLFIPRRKSCLFPPVRCIAIASVKNWFLNWFYSICAIQCMYPSKMYTNVVLYMFVVHIWRVPANGSDWKENLIKTHGWINIYNIQSTQHFSMSHFEALIALTCESH